MKEYAESFYKSKAWQDTRASYLKSVGGLCERCLAKGIYKAAVIVHHKKHIDPQTIKDPRVTLSWDNLEAVCRDCHAELHTANKKRYKLDEMGRVIIL